MGDSFCLNIPLRAHWRIVPFAEPFQTLGGGRGSDQGVQSGARAEDGQGHRTGAHEELTHLRRPRIMLLFFWIFL